MHGPRTHDMSGLIFRIAVEHWLAQMEITRVSICPDVTAPVTSELINTFMKAVMNNSEHYLRRRLV